MVNCAKILMATGFKQRFITKAAVLKNPSNVYSGSAAYLCLNRRKILKR